MAVYNEILVGRFNRALQKLFSLKGEPPAPQLASEVMPVVSFLTGVENRYLEQWYRYAVHLEVAAVAAQNSAARFRNPTNSAIIAVVEKLRVNVNPAGFVNLTGAVVGADLATISNGNAFMDQRGNPKANCITSFTTNIADLGTTFLVETPQVVSTNVDSIITDIQEFAVSPGFAFQLGTRTLNSAMLVDIVWRERILEESERV